MKEADFEVVWPLGRHVQSAQAGGARTETRPRAALDLNSATVAFVWTYNRKGDRMFQIMQGMLRGEYPDISFVDYDVFGNIHGAKEREVVAGLGGPLHEHRCDAVISALGA